MSKFKADQKSKLPSVDFAAAAFIILLAILVRVVLFENFPVFVTNDSSDYLLASTDIYSSLDFQNPGLRDARLPGYPIFLALLYPIIQMNSDRIVLAQILLGTLSVVFGLLIGRALHSRLVAFGLGLFLALNPFFLLTEHMILPETLYLLALLGVILLSLQAMQGKITWGAGIALGLLFGICTLTRVNGLFLCLLLLAGTLLPLCSLKPWKQEAFAKLVRFYIGVILAGSVIIGPWLLRNYYLYQKITFVNYVNRNLLIYKTFHGTIDQTLPLLRAANQSLSKEAIDYEWFQILADKYPSNQAEAIAEELLNEQISHNPRQQWADILESFRCFGGICQQLTGGRSDVRFWFTNIVPDPDLLYKNNTSDWIKILNPTFQYIPHTSNSYLLYIWSRVGMQFAIHIRPLIYILFFSSFVLFILYSIYKFIQQKQIRINFHAIAIFICGFGYLATVVLHSTTLASADRYAAPFDTLSVTVILLVVDQFLRHTSLSCLL
jgi:4-amino-4-deoxy-L-arabinose transferase-like glycosyltransferase